MKTEVTPADCPLVGSDGKPRAMDLSFWRVILPLVMTFLITLFSSGWVLSTRLARMEATMNRVEQGFVPREVLELQLQTLRLEIRAVDFKIDQHMQINKAVDKD